MVRHIKNGAGHGTILTRNMRKVAYKAAKAVPVEEAGEMEVEGAGEETEAAEAVEMELDESGKETEVEEAGEDTDSEDGEDTDGEEMDSEVFEDTEVDEEQQAAKETRTGRGEPHASQSGKHIFYSDVS